jgi:ketosteroid isomerase-like protein
VVLAKPLAGSVHAAAARGELTASVPQSTAGQASRERRAPAVSVVAHEVDRATVLARLFIEALNARDVDGMAELVSDDVVFRNPIGGRSLRGREAIERLVRAATEARVALARRDGEEVRQADGVVTVAVPIVELVGAAEIEGTATFEVRDGQISAFEVASELLRR